MLIKLSRMKSRKSTKNMAILILIIFTSTILISNLQEVRATGTPTLWLPSDGDYVNTGTPTFEWFAVSGAEQYNFQTSTDISFTVTQNSVSTGNTFYTPGIALAEGSIYWRVRAYDTQGGGWGSFSEIREVIIDTIPPAAPTIVTPEYWGYTSDNTPYCEWVSDPAALKYDFQWDDNHDFSSPLYSGGTYNYYNHYPLAALSDGTYYVRVRSEDFAGNKGPWTSHPFDVDTVAPPAPVLTLPAEGAVETSRTVTFDWDSSGGAYFWTIQVSIYSDFHTTVKDLGTNWDAGYAMTFYSDGFFYWRVRQRDRAENVGPWSSVGTFTIDTIGPSAPILISPDDNDFTTDSTPHFQWAPSATAVNYQLQVDTSNQFTSLVRNVTTASLEFISTALTDNTYFWRVRAVDAYGNWGSWGEIREFTIDTLAPSAPTLLEPADDLLTKDATPYLDWEDVSGADSYTVQVSTTDSFSSSVIYETSLPNSFYQILSDLGDDTYYWRVRARDMADNVGSWSIIRSFTIDTTPPSSPELVSPTDSDTLTDPTPLLMWNSVVGGNEYQLQIDLAGTFVSLELNETTSNTFYTILTELPSGVYYWRVRAADELYNWGSWSAVWSFTIDTEGPDAPLLYGPSDMSIIGDDTPFLNWSIVADAIEYEIELATSISFGGSILYSTTTPSDYYNIFFSLTDDVYYWRIRAKDALDNWGNWSTIWVFEVDTVIPIINSPDDIEYEVGDTGYNFSWYPEDLNPSSYIIYLDGTIYQEGVWNSSSEEILIIVDGFSLGTYNFTIYILDSAGNSILDTVLITVTEIIVPELKHTLPIILPVLATIGLGYWLKKRRIN